MLVLHWILRTAFRSVRSSFNTRSKILDGWWDRKIETIRGKDGWDAQLEFLEGVIKRLKQKNSILGFEILNEPQVFRQVKFKKVANYHDYIIKNISAITDKTLFFLLYFFLISTWCNQFSMGAGKD